MESTHEYVTCSCCGQDIPDTPEHNRDFHERGQDTGYGNCTECFGEPPKPKDPKKPRTNAEVKASLGWAGRTFYESRFDTIRKALRPDLQTKWDAMTYAKKVVIVAEFIEEGSMI